MTEVFISEPELSSIEIKVGQYWDRHQHAVNNRYRVSEPEVTHYVVIHVENPDTKGRLVRLENLETEGIARITCRWLREGRSAYPPKPWWEYTGQRPVEEIPA